MSSIFAVKARFSLPGENGGGAPNKLGQGKLEFSRNDPLRKTRPEEVGNFGHLTPTAPGILGRAVPARVGRCFDTGKRGKPMLEPQSIYSQLLALFPIRIRFADLNLAAKRQIARGCANENPVYAGRACPLMYRSVIHSKRLPFQSEA